MKMLSSLFFVGLLCFALTFQTRSHHIWEPEKYFSSTAVATQSDHGDEDDMSMGVHANVSADGVELGGYYITTSGIYTKPKQRRFCGSASFQICVFRQRVSVQGLMSSSTAMSLKESPLKCNRQA